VVRVVLVPGFTQKAASWDAVRAELGSGVDAVAIDVPTGQGFVETAAAIGEVGGHAVYVGYSMGGRLCLRLALDRPDLVRGLVLISASPVIADSHLRAAGPEADEQLAREIERDGVDAFLERWLRQPLFATLPADAAALDARRVGNTVATLTHALRALGQGAQEPLWDRLVDLEPPFLPVAGSLDERYVDIAFEMARTVGGDVRPILLGGAGHAAHLEQPDAVASLLRRVVHDLTS
jgi:2-succinyl-6-hydroxy-2,4-cyclohexadiene-1-carboxylate synthase